MYRIGAAIISIVRFSGYSGFLSLWLSNRSSFLVIPAILLLFQSPETKRTFIKFEAQPTYGTPIPIVKVVIT
jgi:hypothetical protein